MNLSLLNPFAQKSLPEGFETYIFHPGSFAVKLEFNRRGALLAAGGHNGVIVIWDFLTHTRARILEGHVSPITSLSWSKDSRRLCSSSTDLKMRIWDVLSGTEIKMISRDEAVLRAVFNPCNSNMVVMCLASASPTIYRLDTGKEKQLYAAIRPASLQPVIGPNGKDVVNLGAVAFSPDGHTILWGDSFGGLHFVSLNATHTESLFMISDSPGVKHIEFSKRGEFFLVNCTDKKLRYYNSARREVIRIFSDPVRRPHWKCCTISSDGEYIIGGSADKAEHRLYFWSAHTGNLVKQLEGPKEGVMDLVWHPLRPVVCSCAASTGVIFIWTTNYTEHWSAYAPNFVELMANEVYAEKEDEFDVLDPNEMRERKKRRQQEQEEELVDITTLDPIPGLEDEDIRRDLRALPAVPGSELELQRNK